MANNYLQFCEQIDAKSKTERAWLVARFAELEDAACKHIDGEGSDADCGDYDFSSGLGFALIEETDQIYVEADEWGEPFNVGLFVAEYLTHWHPTDSWSMTWSATCSTMRPGEFSGGAMFVTAAGAEFLWASDWIEQQRSAFRNTPPQPVIRDRGHA